MGAKPRSILTDHVLRILSIGIMLAVCLAFAHLLWSALAGGAGQLSWAFLTSNPQSAGRLGGILPILISTAIILGITLAVAVPIGAACAIFLSEFAPDRGVPKRMILASVNLLASTPSIVYGLFGLAFFVHGLGFGYSLISGGLTLAIMVLPLIVHTVYASLRAVPNELRINAAALAMSRWTQIRLLFGPAMIHGLTVGVTLGVARALSETAALLFTSGYSLRMPESPFDSGRAISVHIYDLVLNVPGGEANAHASVLVLMAFLLTLNALTQALRKLWIHKEFLYA